MTRPHERFSDDLDALRTAPPSEAPNSDFQRALEAHLLERFHHTTMPIRNPFLSLRSRPFLPAALVAVVIIALGFAAWRTWRPDAERSVNRPRTFAKLLISEANAQENFAIVATDADGFGVAPETDFRLTSKVDVRCDQLADSVAITPTVRFAVQEVSARECTISPDGELAPGTVYQIALGTTVQAVAGEERREFRWAFQARDRLKVTGMLPRHQATGVPIDTSIEVTFNSDAVENPADHIQIAPETKGRFETHGRTVVFVPEERLKTATVYTVTVAAGLKVRDSTAALPDDAVSQFETAVDAEHGWYSSPFNLAFTAVKPNEVPIITFAYEEPPKDVTATVYAFANADDLIRRFAEFDALPNWAWQARQNARIDPSGLRKVGDFALAVEANVLRFPEGFPAGYYLIDLPIGSVTYQTPLVVSELGGSLTVTKTDGLAWLSDLSDGGALTEARVTVVLSGDEVKSDADGLARFETPDDLKTGTRLRSYLKVAHDDRETLVPIVPDPYADGWGYGMGTMGRGGTSAQSNDYWFTLWTDRVLYRQTDTVNVWGVVKNREEMKPESVTLQVWSWERLDYRGDYLPIVSTTAETSEYGTYRASLPLRQLKTGYYTIGVKIGETVIGSRGFEVKTFTKPAYGITVVPDKEAGIKGEKVTFTVTAAFFDGTPVPHAKLAYAGYGSAGSPGTPIETDDRGIATIEQTLEASDQQWTNFQEFSVFPREAAEGDIVGRAGVTVYPSAVTFTPEAKRSGETVRIDLTTHLVDLESGQAEGWYVQNFPEGPIAPNVPITGKVLEEITEKTKTGAIYDPIEKRVIDDYSYSFHTELIQEFSGASNEQGRFSRDLTLPDRRFTIELRATDAQGRTVLRMVSLASRQDKNAQSSYRLVDERNSSDNYYRPQEYGIGDTTRLLFTKDGATVPARGRFLYLKLQNGLRDAVVTDDPILPVSFSESDVPNVGYAAVWFNGSGFIEVEQSTLPTLQFRSEDRALTIDITPAKPSYGPGDEAVVAIAVKDKDGKPVRATVNVSAIDEAIAALQFEGNPYLLNQLYRLVRNGLLQNYVSHAPLSQESGAEGGGGGEARNNFRDQALFTEVETDRNGEATVRFPLPDNLTSWRITAQAVTKELEAGQTMEELPVTKPVFGLLTMADEYVVQDRPVVYGSAFGAALSADTDVRLRLAIPSLSYDESATAKAYTLERFALPELAVGQHEVRLTVESNGQTDTLVRTMTVRTSRLIRATNTYSDVNVGMSFAGSESERSTLLFTDAGRGRIMNSLETLAWSYGKRLDRHLAARIAADELAALGSQGELPNAGFKPERFQTDSGGISLIDYGDADLRLSAFAAARADLFDATGLERYFLGILTDDESTREQIGYALLGLAELGEPVLPDLDHYVTLEGMTDEDRLVAALAYHALGADDRAYPLSRALLETYGEEQDPYIRLNLGDSDDERIVHTAQFAILAEGLRLEQRFGLSRYVAITAPRETITNLEQALAWAEATRVLDNPDASFTYRIADADNQVAFSSDSRSFELSVTPDELRDIAIISVQGSVAVVTHSLTPVDPANDPHDERLSLTRSYEVLNGNGQPIAAGDVVKITLTPSVNSNVIDSEFTVTDELPSGLVPLATPWERHLSMDERFNYPSEITGQRATFWSGRNRSFYYYARALVPGTYAADPALIQGQTSRDAVNYSDAATVDIR